MAPRRAGWSLAEFQTYWRDQHAPVVCGMPGLRAYLQNHAVLEHGEPLLPWPGFDACAQFGAADPSDFELAFSSLHYTGPVTDDARRFVDTTRGGTMLCDPLDPASLQGTTAAPIGGERVRLLRFLRAAPGVPMDGFLQALRQLEVPQDALGQELHPGSSAAPAAQPVRCGRDPGLCRSRRGAAPCAGRCRASAHGAAGRLDPGNGTTDRPRGGRAMKAAAGRDGQSNQAKEQSCRIDLQARSC